MVVNVSGDQKTGAEECNGSVPGDAGGVGQVDAFVAEGVAERTLAPQPVGPPGAEIGQAVSVDVREPDARVVGRATEARRVGERRSFASAAELYLIHLSDHTRQAGKP